MANAFLSLRAILFILSKTLVFVLSDFGNRPEVCRPPWPGSAAASRHHGRSAYGEDARQAEASRYS